MISGIQPALYVAPGFFLRGVALSTSHLHSHTSFFLIENLELDQTFPVKWLFTLLNGRPSCPPVSLLVVISALIWATVKWHSPTRSNESLISSFFTREKLMVGISLDLREMCPSLTLCLPPDRSRMDLKSAILTFYSFLEDLRRRRLYGLFFDLIPLHSIQMWG